MISFLTNHLFLDLIYRLIPGGVNGGESTEVHNIREYSKSVPYFGVYVIKFYLTANKTICQFGRSQKYLKTRLGLGFAV